MTRPFSQSFGLIAQLQKTRIALPLTHIDTRFRVTGDVATVEIDQVFEQNARKSLDVTYTFPLPGDAAVYRCEMIVNDRLIRAEVMAQEQARRLAEEKKAAGHRTALVQMERDNLFTLELGNTAPGDRIVIRFAYIETLDRLGDQLSLRIPLCPGIRYVPGQPLLRANRGQGAIDDTDQVPDASRLTPPRISGDHPDAAGLFLRGTFDRTEVGIEGLSSPSHPTVLRTADDLIEAELCGEQHLPDRDFVLRWQEPRPDDQPQARAWVSQPRHQPAAAQRHALLQLRAPGFDQTNAADTTGQPPGQDVYFLLDRSGSMEGRNWEQSVAALEAFVRELGSADRVWLTCFESYFQDFSEAPMTRDDILANDGFKSLTDLGTGGGTELLLAFAHVLEVRKLHSANRPARMIIITDGQVAHEDLILDAVEGSDARDLPIHTFGIDVWVNDAFLKDIARASGGRCTLMTPDDDIPAAVRKLAVSLRPPVLTGLQFDADTGWLAPDETTHLSDLHAGDVLCVPLAAAADGPVADRLTVRATAADGQPWSAEVEVGSPVDDDDQPAPRLLWARQRIRHLLSTGRPDDAVAIAVAHNLTCRGASFIAWDPAEKVPVAAQSVYQPSLDTLFFGAAPRAKRAASMSAREPFDMGACYSAEEPPMSYTVASPAPLHADRRRPADRYPDPLEAVVKRARLAGWKTRFKRLLRRRMGLDRDTAEHVIDLILTWIDAQDTDQRARLAKQWLKDLEAAQHPAALMMRQLEADFDPILIDMARLLLDPTAKPD